MMDDLLQWGFGGVQVEIVMGLEEEFGIGVEEESSQNITTVQEAAYLIEKLVQKKVEAAYAESGGERERERLAVLDY